MAKAKNGTGGEGKDGAASAAAPSRGSSGRARLGVWPATAICGNDITSSCLYVSALAIIAAGKLAWVALLIVAAVLYLYRGVYAEAVMRKVRLGHLTRWFSRQGPSYVAAHGSTGCGPPKNT